MKYSALICKHRIVIFDCIVHEVLDLRAVLKFICHIVYNLIFSLGRI